MTATDRNPLPFDILGIGCVAVDDLFYIDAFPQPDCKCRARRSERQCGGLAATALVAAAKLGGRCAFGGRLGTDDLSEFVADTFRRHSISLDFTLRDPDSRPIHSAIIVGERSHTRNIFFDASAPMGPPPEGPPDAALRGAKVLLVDHYGPEGTLKALEKAHEVDVESVADFENDEHPCFPALLALAGHLVLSEAFACRVAGAPTAERSIDALWGERRKAVIVTCGDAGAWFADAANRRPRHSPAFEVPVADTTGCGDVFHGAYALALARGFDLESRVRFASAAAALKAGRPGGQNGSPTAEELDDFLSK